MFASAPKPDEVYDQVRRFDDLSPDLAALLRVELAVAGRSAVDSALTALEDWIRVRSSSLRGVDDWMRFAHELAGALRLQATIEERHLQDDASTRAAALYLLEVLFTSRPNATLHHVAAWTDMEKIQLFRAAVAYVELSNARSYTTGSFGKIDVALNRNDLTFTWRNSVIDLQGYSTALAKFMGQQEDPEDTMRALLFMTAQAPAPSQWWSRLNDLHQRQRGYSLHMLTDMLSTAFASRGALTFPDRESLRSHLSRQARVPATRRQVLKFIEDHTFDSASPGFSPEPFKQRERSYRLALRPIVKMSNGKYYLDCHLALGTLFLYGEYFTRRVTPWPERGGDAYPLDVYMKDWTAGRDLAFEIEASHQLRELGLETRVGVRQLPGMQLDRKFGDVDVLAVDASAGLITSIWVIEAKNPIKTTSPGQMISVVQNMENWREKHLRRARVIQTREGVEAVGRLFSLPVADQAQVHELIVTRAPTVASYVGRTRQWVWPIEELVRYLSATESQQTQVGDDLRLPCRTPSKAATM